MNALFSAANLRRVGRPILSIFIGLSLGMVVVAFAGESPWRILAVLANGAFGSRYGLSMTLHYTVPLIFTGLSVAVAFRSGMFNIGAEGQLTIGAFTAAAVGIILPSIPWPFAPAIAASAAFGAGALWGAVPGYLRAFRGSHEVINTIMMNFIAIALTSWATLYLFKNPESQNPETAAMGSGYAIHALTSLGAALIVAVGVWFFLWKTVAGFEMRAIGENECAAKAAGADLPRLRVLSMAVAGGIAGLAGLSEVLGGAGRFKIGFSPDYGFIGIAVALLGGNRPAGVIAAALLFGALHKGASDLDLETEHVTREISLVLEALIIFSVSVGRVEFFWRRRSVRIDS